MFGSRARRLIAAGLLAACALVAASCGSAAEGDEDSASTPAEGDEDSASTPAQGAGEGAVVPGAVGSGQVTIDGTTIDYVTVVPDGFEPGDTAPVMFAFPPGGQDIELTQRIATGTYMAQALARGWVVFSPAAPDGQLFFNGSEDFVPGLVDWLETWVTPAGGGPHVVGVSNGGISAFRAATQQPDRFASLLVFPGFPRGDADRAAATDLEIPVRMFVGENDTAWVAPMQDAADAITEAGGDAQLEIIADEGHIIASLSDGAVIFDTLDELR